MEIRRREFYGRSGIWFLFVALVLSFASDVMLFPVWEGSNRLGTLLAEFPPSPAMFILARTGWAALLLGLIGAGLIEKGRPRPVHGTRGWWNRERFLVVLYVLSVGISLIISLSPGDFSVDLGLELEYFIGVVTHAVASVSLGLFLLWTAERISGISVSMIGSVAIALALVAWALDSLERASLFSLVEGWPITPSLSISSWAFGAGSVALWVAVFAWILLRRPESSASRLPAAPEA